MADISTLGIVVTQRGIAPTVTALGKLSTAAVTTATSMDTLQSALKSFANLDLGKAVDSVKAISAAMADLRGQMAAINKSTVSFNKIGTSLTALNTSVSGLSTASQQMAVIGANVEKLAGQLGTLKGISTPLSQFRADLNQMRVALDNTVNAAGKAASGKYTQKASTPSASRAGTALTNSNEVQKVSGSVDGLRNSFQSATTAAVGLFAVDRLIAYAKGLATVSDEMINIRSRLSLVTTGSSQLNEVQNALFEGAQKTGTSLKQSSDVYFGLARATKGLGLSTKDLTTLTDGLNKASIVSGANAESYASAMFQLRQGLESGKLSGAEFNSVAEQSPRVLQAIADGLGISTGELRKMSKEQKLTTDVVIPALQKGLQQVDAEFDKMPMTIGRATQAFENQFAKTVDQINTATSATASVTHLIGKLTEGLNQATPALIGMANALPTAAIIAAALAFGKFGGAVSEGGIKSVKGFLATTMSAREAASQLLATAKAEQTAAQASVAAATLRVQAGAQSKAATSALVFAQNDLEKSTQKVEAAQKAYNRSSIAATSITKGFGLVVGALGGPIGIALTSLALLVTYWDDIKVAIGGAIEKQEQFLKKSKQMAAGASTGAELAATKAQNEQNLKSLKAEEESLRKKVELEKQWHRDRRDNSKQTHGLLATEKRLNENLNAQRDTVLEINRLEIQRKLQNKNVADSVRAELEATEVQTKKTFKPLEEKTKTPRVRDFAKGERQENSLEAQLQYVQDQVKSYIDLGDAYEYAGNKLNDYDKKAAALRKDADDANTKEGKETLEAQARLAEKIADETRYLDVLKDQTQYRRDLVKSTQDYILDLADVSKYTSSQTDEAKRSLEVYKLEAKARKEIFDLQKQMNASKDPKARAEIASSIATLVAALQSKAATAGTKPEDLIAQRERDEVAEVESLYTQGLLSREAYEQQLFNIRKRYADATAALQEQQQNRERNWQSQGLDSLSNFTNTTYDLLKKAGQDQTALGKTMFAAMKAIQIAQSIVNIEAAANRALAEGGTFLGMSLATLIRATGYASVGVMAATSIGEVSGAFAKGSAFSGGDVVNTPTYFPMSGGRSGLMGEAGPEVIAPLGRDSTGRLGVHILSGNDSNTSGGNSIVVQVNVNQDGSSDTKTSATGTTAAEAKQIGEALSLKVRQVLVNEMRPGGVLFSR